MRCFFLVVFSSSLASASLRRAAAATCPLTSTTTVALLNDAASSAYGEWYVNFFSWWSAANPTALRVVRLTAAQVKACDLASLPALRMFVNPGGNAYNQLTALGAAGISRVRAYVNRPQTAPSAYVSSCAGSYMAAHDYLWETLYEGSSYYNFVTSPPYSLFPHTVEGSLVDIGDDQFGSLESNGKVKARTVNGSNGQQFVYWGGPSFGWNGVADYADATSTEYDPNITPVLYFKDFYGFQSKNLVAAWTYKLSGRTSASILMATVHPEADQTAATCCLGASFQTADSVKQNWAWWATYMNAVAGTTYALPSVPVAPVFSTVPPHASKPVLPCYAANPTALFCDSFTVAAGTVYPGMFQWQRNQTAYNLAAPWNVTFTTALMGGNIGGAGADGATDGFAVSIPSTATGNPAATIASQKFSTAGVAAPKLSFKWRGKTLSAGGLTVAVSTDDGTSWATLAKLVLNPAVAAWTPASFALPANKASVRIRFACVAGAATTNYCAIDSVLVI